MRLHPHESPLPEDPSRFRLIRGVIVVFAFVALGLAFLGSPTLARWLSPHGGEAAGSAGLTATPTPFQPSSTPTLIESTTPTIGAPAQIGGASSLHGLMVLGMSEFGYSQLFSYQLNSDPFARITRGEWDDIHPSLNPQGTLVAFASNRGGQWDLFLLDLHTGETMQITNDKGYDGRPSWSADGAWLAYEHIEDNNLEIYIRPVDGSIDPVVISNNPGVDFASAWRPGAQQIAFISDRGGQLGMWLVDLEQNGDARFSLVSSDGIGKHSAPAWSPDGTSLAWGAFEDGQWQIYAMEFTDPQSMPRPVGVGAEPHWSPDGQLLLATVRTRDAAYLTAYGLDGSLALAPSKLTGGFTGATWSGGALPDLLPTNLLAAAEAQPSQGVAEMLSKETQLSNQDTIEINLNAPFPELSETVAGLFEALRARTAQLLGWDALSNLENAFVPINQALPPGRQQDWLYTGRAFELHSGLLNAGWMAVLPEEFDGRTYWRIYLRAATDGSLGQPLLEFPWDISARFNGDSSAVQAGGAWATEIPQGNWIDFTALAEEFGFERLPAMPNWRTYYQGALFNQFVLTAGMSWEEAMLQLYSPEVVATASAANTQ